MSIAMSDPTNAQRNTGSEPPMRIKPTMSCFKSQSLALSRKPSIPGSLRFNSASRTPVLSHIGTITANQP